MSIKKTLKKVLKKTPATDHKKVVAKKSPKKTPTKKKVVTKKTAVKKKAPATKTTKKTTSKKSAPKQRVRALVCAPGEKCFWTTDGTVLQDLNQLQMAFGSMGDEVFLHHVTKEKNDFADWVEHVLDDATCAEKLRKTKKPSTARTVVVGCLRTYKL